jgi:hypothetical protein
LYPHNPYYQQSEESFNESTYVDRPDGEDAPSSPPPQQFTQQFAQQMPPQFFSTTAQPNQLRSMFCRCLGRWGMIGLRFQGPFGRDFWFYPTEIRKNSVSGYIWQHGRTQRVRYNYSQIRNFACF